jgi:hypothetical protein
MSTMPMITDPLHLLSELLAYSGHQIAARHFAPAKDLGSLIKAGWLVPTVIPETVLCETCDDAHFVDVVELDGVLSGVCLRTAGTFAVSPGRLYCVDADTIARSLAEVLCLDGAVQRLRSFERLWRLGGRRLDDTRAIFFFTPDLDRLDLATSVLKAVADQSRATTAALIIASDRIDHVQLIEGRHQVIKLRDIIALDADGRLIVDEAQLLTKLVPDAAKPRAPGRPSMQRDLILPILVKLKAEDVPIDTSNETCRIVQDRFQQEYPLLKAPVINTIKAAIDAWLTSRGR